jgi:hypothetical protein
VNVVGVNVIDVNVIDVNEIEVGVHVGVLIIFHKIQAFISKLLYLHKIVHS